MLDLDTKITDHFKYYEVIKSSTAERHGIDNNFNDLEVLRNVSAVAKNILEPIRKKFGPFSPNSWFRSEGLEMKICSKSFGLWCNSTHGLGLSEREISRISFETLELLDLEDYWKEYFSRKQHPKGMSVDIELASMSNLELFEWIKDNLEFDQLILEFYRKEKGPNSGWVHVSFNPSGQNRMQTLVY